MLTKHQATELLERFKAFAWNQETRQFDEADMPYIEVVIRDYTIPAEDELGCPDLESHYYLRGVQDAVLCIKCGIHDEAKELMETEMNAEQFISAIEETIDSEIDYMLTDN